MTKLLKEKPQFRGIITKIYTMKPKKPNSAIRKVAQVKVKGVEHKVIVYIPGIGNNLSLYSTVLVRHGKVQDCPGVRYKIIRGVLDCQGVKERKKKRSKYGTTRGRT